LDILSLCSVLDKLIEDYQVVLHTKANAYNPQLVQERFGQLKSKFMLDDDLHTLQSMKSFIQLYSLLLKEDGILIVENYQSMD